MLRAARRIVGPLLLYGAVVSWLTWPLATKLATHLPATVIASSFDTLYGVGTSPGRRASAPPARRCSTPTATIRHRRASSGRRRSAIQYFGAVFA
jgi:hypothetical protein